MTSCGGTSMVTVLKSILTILSTNGRRIKSPGPLGPPCTRPRRKITPRSYSLTILMALSMTETMNIATITTKIAANPIPTACNKPKVAFIRDSPLILALPFYRRAVVGALRGHHLHRPFLVEAYHGHLQQRVLPLQVNPTVTSVVAPTRTTSQMPTALAR